MKRNMDLPGERTLYVNEDRTSFLHKVHSNPKSSKCPLFCSLLPPFKTEVNGWYIAVFHHKIFGIDACLFLIRNAMYFVLMMPSKLFARNNLEALDWDLKSFMHIPWSFYTFLFWLPVCMGVLAQMGVDTHASVPCWKFSRIKLIKKKFLGLQYETDIKTITSRMLHLCVWRAQKLLFILASGFLPTILKAQS